MTGVRSLTTRGPRRITPFGLAIVVAASFACDTTAQVDQVPPVNYKVAFIGDQGNGTGTDNVLQLIADEGAQAVICSGDFDYQDNPQAWDDKITQFLGPCFPFFASVGNHDTAVFYGPGGYQEKLEARMNCLGITWDGDLGVRSSHQWQGLLYVLTAPGLFGDGDTVYAPYIRDELLVTDSLWRISSWHVLMTEMGFGAPDESGWGVYEESRRGGAVIATGHAHSYARTHPLSNCQTQQVDSSANQFTIALDDPITPEDEGVTFVHHNGLGGHGFITGQFGRCLPTTPPYGCNGEWASIYTADQGAIHGALFGVFNLDGNPCLAYFYFMNVDGVIIDDFTVEATWGPCCPEDSDGDGTPDCTDGCPNDPFKTDPGVCGCGVADTDTDGDGTEDCVDGCPNDPLKITPGTCGCGVPDVDSDQDGTLDCNDGCPNDPSQTQPGPCGCVGVDVDAVSSSSADGPLTITVAHPTAGEDRLMMVGVSLDNDNFETVSSVTYGGLALDFVGQATNSDDARVEIWKLIAPAVGTADVVVTFDTQLLRGAVVGVTTFTGVDQASPLGSFAGDEAAFGTTASVNVAAAAGDLVMGVVAVEDGGPLTAGPDQTEIWTDSVGDPFVCYGAGSTQLGAPTVTVSWDLNTSDHWAIGAVAVKPAPAPPGNDCEAPTVTVNDPPDGWVAGEATPITFDGAAIDIVDGDLSASLAWNSDLDGSIGTGASFTTSALTSGIHTITASVNNGNGQPGSDAITLYVTATASAVDTLRLDIEMPGINQPSLSRCMSFELFDCGGGSQVVDAEITFTEGAALGVEIPVPIGVYTCITASDTQHTLRRSFNNADGFGVVGGRYIGSFRNFASAGVNRSLIAGNLNDDDFIDIFDFGLFTGQFGSSPFSPPCGTPSPPPHADIDGNGIAFTEDFTFIMINFLQASDTVCCQGSAMGGGVSEISVAELYVLGLGQLAAGDLNGDGWLNELDLVAFINGARPEPRGPGNVSYQIDVPDAALGVGPGGGRDVVVSTAPFDDTAGAEPPDVTVTEGDSSTGTPETRR